MLRFIWILYCLLLFSPVYAQNRPDTSLYQVNTLAFSLGADTTARQCRFSVSTNSVYYGALLPNLEASWYFHRRWSLNFEAIFMKRHFHATRRNVQGALFAPSFSYYLKDDNRFTGWRIGVKPQFSTFDYSTGNNTGYLGYAPGVALVVGYYVPLSRYFGIDFALGGGYLRLDYDIYDYYKGHDHRIGDKVRNYFGPTEVKVALVWRPWGKKKQKGGNL